MKTCPYEKCVLVTGASSGIGKETAERFAKGGFEVYALSRSVKEETTVFDGGGTMHGLRGDVTDAKSIQNALSRIERLGIVIHCAGFGIAGSAEYVTSQQAKRQMDTNYFGVINVNNLALPLLRKNKRSLVMFTSSVGGIIPIPYQSHYSSSKYALEAYAVALEMEAKGFGVRVCIVEPGDVKTSFTASREVCEREDSPYYGKCKESVSNMEKSEQRGSNPIDVAKVFFKMAHRKRPKIRVAVGLQYKIYAFLIKLLPTRFKNFVIAKMY